MFIGLVTAGLITVSTVTIMSYLSESYGYNALGVTVRMLIPLITVGAIVYIFIAMWGAFL